MLAVPSLGIRPIIIMIIIIIIMYIYHALINALSAHITHINLNMIFYTIKVPNLKSFRLTPNPLPSPDKISIKILSIEGRIVKRPSTKYTVCMRVSLHLSARKFYALGH